ncbi:MAG TPA: hypothetical protein VF193_12570 [Steroidobacter sp.]
MINHFLLIPHGFVSAPKPRIPSCRVHKSKELDHPSTFAAPAISHCPSIVKTVLLILEIAGCAVLTGCSERPCQARESARIQAWISDAQQRAAVAIDCDADDITTRISALGLAADDAAAFKEQTQDLAELALTEIATAPIESSRLPLSAAHQQMYEVLARAEDASNDMSFRAWATNPWDYLHPLEQPPENPLPALSTAVARGESRALAVNVRNLSAAIQRLRIQIVLPDLSADSLQIYRVNWTGTRSGNWVAGELELLGDASSARQTALLPGVTQQLWIRVRPSFSAAAGRFHGSISLGLDSGPTTQIPLNITVFRTQFPQRPAMHFGGWDYADGRTNRHYTGFAVDSPEFVRHLQERLVDTPWGHRHLMSWEQIDENGNVTRSLDRAPLEQWLSLWTDARRFRVFLDVGPGMAGIPLTDTRFSHAVTTWAQAWAEEIRRLNKSPEQFDLLLIDEPASEEQARLTEAWAQAIRQSHAGFRIWVDPFWRNPNEMQESLIDVVDTIAINLGVAEQAGTVYWDWARKMLERGKEIEIYGTEGPARRLDPYAYYRLTVWKAFFLGATGVSFWSFSDTGGSASDNEFAAQRDSYSPLFISTEGIRPGKHMEAAVEGIQDTQYLRMLQQIAATHPRDEVRDQAREFLNAAAILAQRAPRASEANWSQALDRTEADRQRQAMGAFLDFLMQ